MDLFQSDVVSYNTAGSGAVGFVNPYATVNYATVPENEQNIFQTTQVNNATVSFNNPYVTASPSFGATYSEKQQIPVSEKYGTPTYNYFDAQDRVLQQKIKNYVHYIENHKEDKAADAYNIILAELGKNDYFKDLEREEGDMSLIKAEANYLIEQYLSERDGENVDVEKWLNEQTDSKEDIVHNIEKSTIGLEDAKIEYVRKTIQSLMDNNEIVSFMKYDLIITLSDVDENTKDEREKALYYFDLLEKLQNGDINNYDLPFYLSPYIDKLKEAEPFDYTPYIYENDDKNTTEDLIYLMYERDDR